MRTHVITTLGGLGALLGLASCPGPKGGPDGNIGPNGNPLTLWLAPNNSEVIIQLIDHAPAPW